MSWYLFSWTVLPLGGALAAMLASGQWLLMSAAHRLLTAPVRVGKFRPSLATLMTAFCMVLGLMSYSCLRRCEARLTDADALAHPLLWEQGKKNAFLAGRNFYMCLLGFSLWSVAWRLNSLYRAKALCAPKLKDSKRAATPATRCVHLALGIGALLLADLPLCRINYNLQLATFVTPKKDKILASVGPCENVFREHAHGQCVRFCDDVRDLCEDRLWSVEWARRWHVLGSYGARLFDSARGVEQGKARIDGLFLKKSCADVARSVDKSNQKVNWMCLLVAGLSLVGGFAGVTNAVFAHDADESLPDHPDHLPRAEAPVPGVPCGRVGAEEASRLHAD